MAATSLKGGDAGPPPVLDEGTSCTASAAELDGPTASTRSNASGRRSDYAKWDRLDVGEEEEEDPMMMPVCEEIPWHSMEPLVDRILDERYGPWPPQPQPRQQPAHQPARSLQPEPERPAGAAAGRPWGAAVPAAATVPAVTPSATAPQTADQLRHAGNSAFRRRDYSVALSCWERAAGLASEAEDVELWSTCCANAAQAELCKHNWPEAEALANKVIAQFPKHEKALYRRGLAREAQGDLDDARHDFLRIISANFMNCEAQDALSRIQERLRVEGRWSSA